MIGSVRGRIESKSPPQLTVDVGGLGYELVAPMSTFFVLPGIGEEVRLLTHLVVREDAHILYGFGTEDERRLFRSLIRVSGVGPKIALATLSGIMNSVATLISVDFYDRLVKDPTQKKSVFFAELMTIAVGLIGIGLALLLSRFDVHSLFDVSIELAGLLGGGFAGAYTLGMFTRRANSPGVAIGIGSSICLTLVAWWFKLVHPYFYLAISILLCIVIGYLASLFFPTPARSLKGLTIYADRAGRDE